MKTTLPTYTKEQLESIQREKQIVWDLKRDVIRQTIYEVKEFCIYVMITKELGEITRYMVAQNPLTIHLNR